MRKHFPYVIIIILGLSLSIFSYTKLVLEPNQKVGTVKVVVASHDIQAYKDILPSDLVFKEVRNDEVGEGAVTDPQQLIGRHSKTTLYAGWPINSKTIEESKDFKDKHVVAINIDYARSAGAKSGDVVDVYYVKSSSNDLSLPLGWSEKVASEVIVLSVEGVEGAKGAATGNIGTAVLAVDKSFTHKLVPGATKDNDRYVLAVRHEITGETTGISAGDLEGAADQEQEREED